MSNIDEVESLESHIRMLESKLSQARYQLRKVNEENFRLKKRLTPPCVGHEYESDEEPLG